MDFEIFAYHNENTKLKNKTKMFLIKIYKVRKQI